MMYSAWPTQVVLAAVACPCWCRYGQAVSHSRTLGWQPGPISGAADNCRPSRRANLVALPSPPSPPVLSPRPLTTRWRQLPAMEGGQPSTADSAAPSSSQPRQFPLTAMTSPGDVNGGGNSQPLTAYPRLTTYWTGFRRRILVVSAGRCPPWTPTATSHTQPPTRVYPPHGLGRTVLCLLPQGWGTSVLAAALVLALVLASLSRGGFPAAFPQQRSRSMN